jgi:hypothetical protein
MQGFLRASKNYFGGSSIKKSLKALLYHLSKIGQTSTKYIHETWRLKYISPVVFRPPVFDTQISPRHKEILGSGGIPPNITLATDVRCVQNHDVASFNPRKKHLASVKWEAR